MTFQAITYRVPDPAEIGLGPSPDDDSLISLDPKSDDRYDAVRVWRFYESDEWPWQWQDGECDGSCGEASSREEAMIAYAVATRLRHKVYVPTWHEMGFGVNYGYHGEATYLGVLDGGGEAFDPVEGIGPTYSSTSHWTPLHDLDSPAARWFVAVLVALDAGLPG